MTRPAAGTDDNPWPAADELEIGAAAVAQLRVDAPGSFRLIDCRERDEWDFCRIDGADLVPLDSLVAGAAGHFPDRDARLVVYCHHGIRSARAAAVLRARGWRNAWSMAGGIEAWSLDVDPSIPRY